MRVAILLPVYNGEATIERAIRSVMAQTYDLWRLIVVDNNSTDNTAKIVQKLQKEYSCILSYTCEQQGIVPALNKGLFQIMCSDAVYIARIDADDAWHPTKLEQQVEFLTKNPTIDIVGTQILRVEGPKFQPCLEQIRYPTDDYGIRRRLFEGHNSIAHPSVMFRKEVILRTGGYDNTYPVAEDYHLWLKSAQWFNFANLDEVLVQYTVAHNPTYNPRCPQLCCISMRTALEQLHYIRS